MVFECLNNYQQHCNCQPAKMDILGKTVQRNVLKHAMGVTISMVCVIMDVCLAGVVISAINVLVFSILQFFSLHLQYIQCSCSPFYNYLFLFRIPKFRTENQLEVYLLLSACYFVHFAHHNWFTYCLQRGNKVNHFYIPYKLNKLTYSSRVYQTYFRSAIENRAIFVSYTQFEIILLIKLQKEMVNDFQT